MSSLVVAKALPLQAGLGGEQIVDGRITAADGRHVLMLVEPKFGSSDVRASAPLMAEMMRTLLMLRNSSRASTSPSQGASHGRG
jgi:hypothetical protein